jgi:hypothetical protein
LTRMHRWSTNDACAFFFALQPPRDVPGKCNWMLVKLTQKNVRLHTMTRKFPF